MDAVDLLEHHHRLLEKQFTALKDGSETSPGAFKAAADLLVTHMTLEEELFYPEVKARRTEDILLESLEEHLSLKRVLADLLPLAPDDEQFGPKMHVLAEQLEHHHDEEEDHLFPKVRKLLSDDERRDLGLRMLARERVLADRAPRKLVLGQTDEAAPLPDAAR